MEKNKNMIKSNYKLVLTGTVSDGQYTHAFTQKDVTYIEFEFGSKKIEIGKKSLEKEIKLLKAKNVMLEDDKRILKEDKVNYMHTLLVLTNKQLQIKELQTELGFPRHLPFAKKLNEILESKN